MYTSAARMVGDMEKTLCGTPSNVYFFVLCICNNERFSILGSRDIQIYVSEKGDAFASG